MFPTLVPFCFSLTFVSLTFTKLVHLSIHAKTVSPAAFIIYLPSIILPDVFLICLSRLALRHRKGAFAISACVLACIFSCILFGAASSVLGFWYETGNEIKWAEAKSFAGDADGMKILLSGLNNVIGAGLIMLVVAWFARWYLYRAVGALLTLITEPIAYVWHTFRGSKTTNRRNYMSLDVYDSESDDSHDDIDETKEDIDLEYGECQRMKDPAVQKKTGIILGSVLGFLALTTAIRPSAPYDMMSTSLPFAMLDMFKTPDACAGQAVGGNAWPLPELIKEWKWERPNKNFPGWAPGSNNDYVRQYRENPPKWLPKKIPSGFQKWTPKNESEEIEKNQKKDANKCASPDSDGTFYNPVSDPMKISNLDNDLLDALKPVLGGGDVKIKHVALILMESFREELFPLQMGSDYHKILLKSHEGADEDEINERLSQLSPVAERITGKSGNWKKKDGSRFDPVEVPEWKDNTPEGFGGINVVGGFTTASLSFKSMAAIHCGAWPMPVDSFEESETWSYQACIPQVLDLFNKIKENKTTDDFLEQQWYPAFFQSITDGYDRQDKFDKKIGFKHVVTKSRLDHDAEEKGEELEEINYFGYAETTLREHLKAYLKDIKENNRRMFFSHFTSTTHHPWGVPSSYETKAYLSTEGKMGWHEDFNNYINAIRFTDAWLGEVMQTFDDFGMTNETLIVFVGDHGQAFKEDYPKTGTYENGHVSNFRVPITFRHPNIPRIQYHANATSISILPTILDLLINTGSLNEKDTEAASDLVHEYEGQSLIRPYKASHNGRRAWNFGVVNAGASMLSMTSADAPWRIVIPLDDSSQYRFANLKEDPLELKPFEKWSVKDLTDGVLLRYGEEASTWVTEAVAVAQWWGLERKRLWGYNPGDTHEDDNEEENEEENEKENDD